MAEDLKIKELISALSNGDKNALYTIYDTYSSALYGVIVRMCRDEDMAQDLLQETFIKIWQKIDSYDSDKGKFYTWAYRIAKNTTLNALRKPDLLIQSEDLSVYKDKALATNLPNYVELKGAIQKLEPHHQEAIALVYFRGYTHREAYIKMGVPLGTFKSYIRQALSLLRETYKRDLVLIWFCIEILA